MKVEQLILNISPDTKEEVEILLYFADRAKNKHAVVKNIIQ